MHIIATESRTVCFIRRNKFLILLALIALASFWFNFYSISKNGYANEYYSAAIRSMTQSFKNFFYVSFDPSGMVSVDKPPLGLWVQAIFVWVFGYQGWVMILPQALAGTASCILLYSLTAKYFDKPAGLLASLIFALTPAVVVASRNNTMDLQLVFVLLAATWFFFRSIETSKRRYLYATALMIGIGFNVKMLQAYMMIPAVVITYLIYSKQSLVKRLKTGIAATVILVAVSLSWAVIVDLTPADCRPYVDSSSNNSVAELIIGHNGLERLYGQTLSVSVQPDGGSTSLDGGGLVQDGGSRINGSGFGPDGTSRPAQDDFQNGSQGMPNGQQNSFPGKLDGSGVPGNIPSASIGGSELGSASPLRLFGSSIYGQISWLIILALFALPVYLNKSFLRKLSAKNGVFFYWVLWFAAMWSFFSFAGFYHRYYLCMLAPAIAVLAGAAVTSMIKAWREKDGWRQFLLPLSFIATLAVQIYNVWGFSQLRTWLVPLMAVTGLLSLAIMFSHTLRPKRGKLAAAVLFLMISLLAAPTYWSLTAVLYVPNASLPIASPELAQQREIAPSSINTDSSTYTGLEKYLVDHYKGGSFLVVSERSGTIAKYIIDTGLPAYAYGGFLGSDNSMTMEKLKQLVKEGKVTYFLLSDSASSNSDIASYVKEHATLIDSSEYNGNSQALDGKDSYSLYCFE